MTDETFEGFRLSPQQHRLWVLQDRDGAQPYRTIAEARFGTAVAPDAERLRRAWDAVVSRHEILRTTFRLLPGMASPLQVIDERPSAVFEVEDAENAARTPETAAPGVDTDPSGSAPSRVVLRRRSSGEWTLAFDFSALCADRVTIDRILGELDRLYAGDLPADALEPALQYADAAEWWHELLEKPESASGLAYWRGLDLGTAASDRLPFEREAGGGTFEPRLLEGRLSGESLEALEGVCARLGLAPAAFALACWQVVLQRLTGNPAVVVGYSTDGRRLAELKEVLGPCARYAPIVARLEDDPPFREAANRVSRDLLAQEKWTDLFTWDLEPAAASAPVGTPFFAFGFDYQEDAPAAAGALSFRRQIDSRLERFKVRLLCERSGGELTIGLEFDAACFESRDADRLLARFRRCLQSAVADPGISIGRLDILPADERRRLEVDWNDTAREFADGRLIHERFEEQAARGPDEIALVCGDERLTFSRLNARANRIAHRLREGGVVPDTLVALSVDRSVEMVVGLLAIWKAGGAYVPVEPSLPAERLAFLLEETGAAFLLTRSAFVERFPAGAVRIFLLDSNDASDERDENPAPSARSEHLAYVIFTSGSTGRPKGVAVEHRQISNYVNGILERLDSFRGAAFATVTTLSADLGNTSLFPSLAAGGRLHVIPEQRSSDPESLADDFEREPVDYLKIVPSHLAALLSGSRPERILPRRCLVLGGESSSWDLVKKIRAFAPECRVLNHYGPTEATIGVTTFEVPRDIPREGARAVPVGRPLPNCRIYLLDPRGQAVATGVAGELHIAGAGLARGYLNRPEITAERFIRASIGGREERLYRTGDLARYREDGNLDLLGRTDDQVKLHGFRIEPGEIEWALRQHPSIDEVVVLPREVPGIGRRLVAYLVARRGETPPGTELRAFLLGKLPEFMLPSAFVGLRRFPLTRNGKVDRAALPLPEAAPLRASDDRVAPVTAEEKILARVWAQVLKIEEPGVHDNFFELGGDSILAIQIIARAAREGLRLTPRQLFEQQTIAELAPVAGKGAGAVRDQGPVTGPVPLTPIQHWFFEQDLEDPHHFNQAVFLDAPEALNPAVLERAVEAVVAHHDALRLRFENAGGTWSQRIAPPGETRSFSRVDFDGVAPDRTPEMERVAAESQAGLNLRQGSLFRAVFFPGAATPDRLLLIAHHLVVDTFSWRPLLEDLERAYRQIEAGESAALPPKTTSFQEWARALVALESSGSLASETPYWKRQDQDSGPSLARDHAGENTVDSARSVVTELSEDHTKALLQDVPVAYRSQINDALLAALVRAFSDWTDMRSLRIDLEAHGREDVAPGIDLSRTVGWFTARFPLRLERPEGADAAEGLTAVKELLREIPRRGVGYGVLRYLGGFPSPRNAGSEPEVSFNYLGQLDPARAERPLFRALPTPGPTRSPRARRPHLISVEGKVLDGRLRFAWIYSEAVHRRDTISRLAESFRNALIALIAQCREGGGGYTPSDFPNARLSKSDLDTLLAGMKTGKSGVGR